MSRTNHHRRNYTRWNITEQRVSCRWSGGLIEETEHLGMEVWDLRFYAGCRRAPQVIHKVLYFGTQYPVRFHYGQDGVAKGYAEIRESQFRTDARRYAGEARAVWNAGGEVDELFEPDKRPRSIEWDLW